MSDSPSKIGSVGWFDLTVEDAPRIRDFYASVTGWTATPLKVGDHDDYVMNTPADGEGVAGVCHAKGQNEGLPVQWLMYIIVADLDASMANCHKLGGAVIHGPRAMGKDRFCVIRDPAGAVAGLYQKGEAR